MRGPQLGNANPVWLTKVVAVPLPLWSLYLAGSMGFVFRGKPSDLFSSSITS